MSSGRSAAGAAERVGSGAGRVMRFWRGLPHERRLAAGSAIGLFVTLFLPWYQETVIAPGTTNLRSASATLTGWAAFSFVEAAVLLVAAGVLALLFIRAEGRAFHVPGGDGGVITAAGFWTCVLIIWRIFDKQGTDSHGQFATTSGIEWGIFIALLVAAVMTYAGNRIRAAHQPEPPLPGEEPLLKRERDPRGRTQRRAWTPRPVAADAPPPARADAPPPARADAPPQARADVAALPTRRRRPLPEPRPTRPPGTVPDNPPRPTRPQGTVPDNAPPRSMPPRARPAGAPQRSLPLDPVPADADWEIGEFRTRRLSGDDRDGDRAERPDDQLTIPLDHDD